jgi:ribosomal-protein-alanine N-acetyltransferase
MRAVNITIRTMRETDLPEILKIEEGALPNPYPLGYLRFLAKGNPDTFLVAENESGIVGYIIADVRRRNEGHLISIAVREDERRQGIARSLIGEVDSRFMALGVKVVRLEVRANNAPAINLYHSVGYQDIGLMRGYYRDGEDAISMVATKRGKSMPPPQRRSGGA